MSFDLNTLLLNIYQMMLTYFAVIDPNICSEVSGWNNIYNEKKLY